MGRCVIRKADKGLERGGGGAGGGGGLLKAGASAECDIWRVGGVLGVTFFLFSRRFGLPCFDVGGLGGEGRGEVGRSSGAYVYTPEVCVVAIKVACVCVIP